MVSPVCIHALEKAIVLFEEFDTMYDDEDDLKENTDFKFILFGEGRTATTIQIWLSFLGTLIVLYFILRDVVTPSHSEFH